MNPKQAHQADAIGELGEGLAAQWLQAQGYRLLHRRWHCRWGELDLVCVEPEMSPQDTGNSLLAEAGLVFVEVKTRNLRSWDEGGMLAITPQKQAKLWRTANAFLSSYSFWADRPCRFDVILVAYWLPGQKGELARSLGSTVTQVGYQFAVYRHIPSAFCG